MHSDTIVTQFNPPVGMTPMMSGLLADGVAYNYDYIAGLLYFAQKGFVTFQYEDIGDGAFDYRIILSKNIEELNDLLEQSFLCLFFGDKPTVGASILFHELNTPTAIVSFGRGLQYFNALLKQKMIAIGFWKENGRNAIMTKIFRYFGPLLFATGVAFMWTIGPKDPVMSYLLPVLFFGGMITFLISFAFFPDLTLLGKETKNNLLGYRRYIKTVYKDRFSFHIKSLNDLVVTEGDDFIYAVALGTISWLEFSVLFKVGDQEAYARKVREAVVVNANTRAGQQAIASNPVMGLYRKMVKYALIAFFIVAIFFILKDILSK